MYAFKDFIFNLRLISVLGVSSLCRRAPASRFATSTGGRTLWKATVAWSELILHGPQYRYGVAPLHVKRQPL